MSNWQTPVTDRTQDDVDNRTAKGLFNVADWVRIHGNAEVVKALVAVVYGQDIDPSTLTAPSTTTIPTVEDFNAFLEFIDMNPYATLTGCTLTEITTEYIEGAGGTSPDWEDANNWEQNIETLRDFIARHLFYMPSCGVPSAGQSMLWQTRFRTWAFVQDAVSPVRSVRSGLGTCGAVLTRGNGSRRY
jgi:hypothetical protein